jgi:fucose 4-O-acetylase-like acetyltransferase
MLLSIDTWLLPAIAAGASSYLVSLAWEKIRYETSPGGLLAILLAILSFLMGGICAYYRQQVIAPTLENNFIMAFVVGATTTYIWLLLRRHFPGYKNRER